MKSILISRTSHGVKWWHEIICHPRLWGYYTASRQWKDSLSTNRQKPTKACNATDITRDTTSPSTVLITPAELYQLHVTSETDYGYAYHIVIRTQCSHPQNHFDSSTFFNFSDIWNVTALCQDNFSVWEHVDRVITWFKMVQNSAGEWRDFVKYGLFPPPSVSPTRLSATFLKYFTH